MPASESFLHHIAQDHLLEPAGDPRREAPASGLRVTLRDLHGDGSNGHVDIAAAAARVLRRYYVLRRVGMNKPLGRNNCIFDIFSRKRNPRRVAPPMSPLPRFNLLR